MPIYEYRCGSCGHELEKLQRMSDADLTDCPSCGKSTLNRMISAAGFRLKGSGWYETDFKKDGKKNLHGSTDDSGKPEKKSAVEPAKTTETKKTGKSESKPASTAASDTA